jgi:hypothetical protein
MVSLTVSFLRKVFSTGECWFRHLFDCLMATELRRCPLPDECQRTEVASRSTERAHQSVARHSKAGKRCRRRNTKRRNRCHRRRRAKSHSRPRIERSHSWWKIARSHSRPDCSQSVPPNSHRRASNCYRHSSRGKSCSRPHDSRRNNRRHLAKSFLRHRALHRRRRLVLRRD